MKCDLIETPQVYIVHITGNICRPPETVALISIKNNIVYGKVIPLSPTKAGPSPVATSIAACCLIFVAHYLVIWVGR